MESKSVIALKDLSEKEMTETSEKKVFLLPAYLLLLDAGCSRIQGSHARRRQPPGGKYYKSYQNINKEFVLTWSQTVGSATIPFLVP